ncbi:MAG TPA: redoxin family protein, partial [Methylocella sp.]|nr:redoxin family protein [Methylocella sp.]
MTIQIGDSIPKTSFVIMTPDGPEQRSSDQIFKGKKIVLFGVAGAFTPVCDKNHLPGSLMETETLRARSGFRLISQRAG